LHVNAHAWRARLRPGMRYASALSLEARLRAGTVGTDEVDAACAALVATLRRFTPHVEPSREEAGVFWMDASGLHRLYATPAAWGRGVVHAAAEAGFDAFVAVAFTRFGTLALARAAAAAAPRMPAAAALRAPTATRGRCVVVCAGIDDEKRRVGEVRLDVLGVDAALRDGLARLGIHTVAAFVALPAGGVRRRFGDEGAHLHRRARGDAWDPLAPVPEEEAPRRSVVLDDPVADRQVVLLVARRLLAALLATLAARGHAAVAVALRLHRSLRRDDPALEVALRTASPTLDEAVLMDLLALGLERRLREAARPLSVVEVEVEVEGEGAPREQLRLFHERTRRDLAAGTRALARLRAEFGDDAVVRAVPADGHLPEARYRWEPLHAVVPAAPRVVRERPLVRRVYPSPVALPPRPLRERDDGWIPVPAGDGGRAHERVEQMAGPYVVSGGWWNREVHREYHYARTADGQVLWVYYDRPRRRWFLCGKVE
jgi:protein ImuB